MVVGMVLYDHSALDETGLHVEMPTIVVTSTCLKFTRNSTKSTGFIPKLTMNFSSNREEHCYCDVADNK